MFKKGVYLALISVILILLFSSCSEYQKLLKSNDYDLKYEKAMEYYDAEDYIRASTLLEELMAVYRGTETAEQVYYRYAYTYYYQKDYFTAGYYFDHFVSNFPNSKYADECAFMKAYCFYMDSPSPNLDQTSTYKAIDELQIFINRHPQSTRIEECNRLIDELNDKLVEKSFNGAKLYFDLGEFKASITALNNSLLEYPDTKYREELLYLILKSNFELARNSIQEKIRERYEQTTEAYYKLVEEFPETKHLREAERIYQAAQKAL
jgi:outer membrane protein assembly factor BamD